MKKIMPTLAVGALALTLLVPSASFAASTATDGGKTLRSNGVFTTAQKMERGQRSFNQQQLMELVKKYTPNLVDEYQSYLDKIPKAKEFPKMDEATKQKMEENRQKINEIRQKVKDGTLTEEQAKAEMEALGLKGPAQKEMGSKNHQKDNTYSKLMQAVKANDESQIKEMLNQLLTELQNKLQ